MIERFTAEELVFMESFGIQNRQQLIDALRGLRTDVPEERELTERVICKLEATTDAEFNMLDMECDD